MIFILPFIASLNFIISLAFQTNTTIDPFGSVLEKYGLPGLAIFLMLLSAYWLSKQQIKQVNARLEADKNDKERNEKTEQRYVSLQDEVRLKLSEANADAKQREIGLLEKLSSKDKTVAELQVKVAVLEEQAKFYDERIGFVKLQLQMKQNEFENAESERHALEDELGKVKNMLTAVEHAYQLLRVSNDEMVADQNIIKNDIKGLKHETQTVPTVTDEQGLRLSGVVTLSEANPT